MFAGTSEVIKAERVLRPRAGPIRVMGPPPEIQTGCDLVIEFPLVQDCGSSALWRQSRLSPLGGGSGQQPRLQPVNLFQVKDFGDYLMVPAANMKLTIAKASRCIVNVSGAAVLMLPDPGREMVGQTTGELAVAPDIGHTLCGYAELGL